jgi:hypothetical protein
MTAARQNAWAASHATLAEADSVLTAFHCMSQRFFPTTGSPDDLNRDGFDFNPNRQSIMRPMNVFSCGPRRGRSRVTFQQTAPPDSLAGREQSPTEARSRAVAQAGVIHLNSFNFNLL